MSLQRALPGCALLLCAATAAAQTPVVRRPPGAGRLPSAAQQLVPSAPRARGSAANAAAQLQFVPEVSVGVARTDNLTLSADNPEAQTILELIPAFTLTKSAPRFSADAAYRLEGYRYQQRHDSQVANEFDGVFSVGLQPNNAFFDFGANRTQAIRDPRAPIPSSNLPISTNLLNRDEYYGGPRLQYQIGSNVMANASYRRSWIRYKQGPSPQAPFQQAFQSGTTSFSLDNYLKQRGFTWAVNYTANDVDYQLYPTFKYRRAVAQLGFWAGRGVRLFASGGRESPWNKLSDASLSDRLWEAGFALQGGPRFNAEFAAGERTFGASRRGSLNLMLRRGRLSLRYDETPTTSGLNRYSTGGLLQPTVPNDYLTRPGSAERYISKRSEASWSVDLRRTTFSITAFNESRKQRTQADGTPLPDEKQSGGNVSVTWRAGVRTEFVLVGRRARREFSASAGDRRDDTAESIAVNHRVGAHTQASLEYAHSVESSPGGALGRDYTANLISVLLTRTFGRSTNAAAANGFAGGR